MLTRAWRLDRTPMTRILQQTRGIDIDINTEQDQEHQLHQALWLSIFSELSLNDLTSFFVDHVTIVSRLSKNLVINSTTV